MGGARFDRPLKLVLAPCWAGPGDGGICVRGLLAAGPHDTDRPSGLVVAVAVGVHHSRPVHVTVNVQQVANPPEV